MAPVRPAGPESLTFSDVIGELHRIAALASSAAELDPRVSAACRRAESLLTRLRNQFMDDVLASPGDLRPAS